MTLSRSSTDSYSVSSPSSLQQMDTRRTVGAAAITAAAIERDSSPGLSGCPQGTTKRDTVFPFGTTSLQAASTGKDIDDSVPETNSPTVSLCQFLFRWRCLAPPTRKATATRAIPFGSRQNETMPPTTPNADTQIGIRSSYGRTSASAPTDRLPRAPPVSWSDLSNPIVIHSPHTVNQDDTMGAMLRAGDSIPDLTLDGPEGAVRLKDLVGQRSLVLYFYPKDDTPGCTVQACTFRDSYEEFLEAGAQVVGISSDPPSSHGGFASRHRLPFLLLSDSAESARRAFGVKSTLGLLPGRVTFVIDRQGTIRYVFSSQLRPKEHVARALEQIRSLA